METTTDILVTRELDDSQVALARRLGLNPIILPAIRASFPGPGEELQLLAESYASQYASTPWVFTSKNGVKGYVGLESGPEPVAGLIRKLKEKHPVVYAVGHKTADALMACGLKARVPGEQNAIGLAGLVIEDLGAADEHAGPTDGAGEHPGTRPGGRSAGDGHTVIHWCGNRSREELGTLLEEAGIRLVRQVVYHTHLNELVLPDAPVDAILFFSPSAVQAFRRSIGFQRDLPELFAVGSTTAETLSLESGKNVHIPAEPSTESLLELTADILNSRKNPGR